MTTTHKAPPPESLNDAIAAGHLQRVIVLLREHDPNLSIPDARDKVVH